MWNWAIRDLLALVLVGRYEKPGPVAQRGCSPPATRRSATPTGTALDRGSQLQAWPRLSLTSADSFGPTCARGAGVPTWSARALSSCASSRAPSPPASSAIRACSPSSSPTTRSVTRHSAGLDAKAGVSVFSQASSLTVTLTNAVTIALAYRQAGTVSTTIGIALQIPCARSARRFKIVGGRSMSNTSTLPLALGSWACNRAARP